MFSRKPDSVKLPDDAHLTPIPAGDRFSSLSAIILDDVFYDFVKENCQIKDDCSLLNIPGLICLKAKAYFELKERKTNNENISDKEIKKHRNDIFRLVPLLSQEEKIILPDRIKGIIIEFLNDVIDNPPDFSGLQKDLKAKNIEATLSKKNVISRISFVFELEFKH